MRALSRMLRAVLTAALLAAIVLFAWGLLHRPAQDLPWTPLDLGEPPGQFTGARLTALARQGAECRRLLTRAGVRFAALPPRHEGQCGYSDAVRFKSGGALGIALAPAGVGMACPVAAGLAMWEWNVVQPAAQARFGSAVVTIDHFGSYNCRRIRGSDSRHWSEHATANAIDIAGFRLADGTRITVARDWRSDGKKAAFLHDVRRGACDVFATVLSPDYNAAHADHLHLDQATRGGAGWRACR